MPITYSNTTTIRDINKDSYFEIYSAKVDFGNYTSKFKRVHDDDGIENLLDSTLYNAAEVWRGYIPLGNAFTPGSFVKALGRFIVPTSNPHDFDRSATYKFNSHIKICSSAQLTSARENRMVRYLPNKRKPISIDLYPFQTTININTGKGIGGYSKALKLDIQKVASNNFAMYLGRKEQVYLGMDMNYHNLDGSLTHPPELTYYNGKDMAFQNDQPFDTAYRRKVASFMYFGVNQESIIYEKDDNAANVFMNKQLNTTNKNYIVNEITEEIYTEDKSFGELLEKYFDNVDVDNLLFEYKGIKYHLEGQTIYNENNEEVLGIELDNGSIFSFSYEKYISYGLKDKVKQYIDSFLNYIKTRTPRPTYNSKYYMIGWKIEEGEYESGPGEHSGGYYESWKYISNENKKPTNFNIEDTYNKGETSGLNKPNYLSYKADECYSGKYNSFNLFPLEQLISINIEYQHLYKEQLSKSADEISGNASYENSMFVPIMAMNYIIPTGEDSYYRIDNGSGDWSKPVMYPGGWDAKTSGELPVFFKDSDMCPYAYQIASYYNNTMLGYNHSNTTEHYFYIPETSKLSSVLDNYLGYYGEGGNIVYQYNADGSIKTEQEIDSEGNVIEVPLIDEEKTTYPVLADEDSASLLSRRVYKTLKSYPKIVDFDRLELKQAEANVHTISYNETNRTENDTALNIEVEALFQVKELQYNLGILAYSKQDADNQNNPYSIQYEKNFKFSPLLYVYDTTEFNPYKWTQVPQTKRYIFNFCEDVIKLVDKLGTRFIRIEYVIDGETKYLDIDGTSLESVKLAMSGNKYRRGFIKSLPQVFVNQGKSRIYAREEPSYMFLNFFLCMGFLGTATLIIAAMKWIPGIGKIAWNFWWDNIISLLAARRDITCQSFGYIPRQQGDYFYNIGNKWSFIYHKNRGEPLHIWDKFENPGFYMNRTNKNERKIRLNPPAARVYTDRDFTQKTSKHYNPYTNEYQKVGLGYLERPFVFNCLTTDEINRIIGKKSKFRGEITDAEAQALLAMNKQKVPYTIYNYQNKRVYTAKYNQLEEDWSEDASKKELYYEYTVTSSEGSKKEKITYKYDNKYETYQIEPYETDKFKEYNDHNSNITHIYQGQKFSMTFMLNNNFRRVQHLIRLAYIYCNYLCETNGINNSRKTIITILSHRMPMYYFRKNLRLEKRDLSELELNTMENKYEAIMIGDWLWLYNKRKKNKIGFDFKTYIPDFRSHYGYGQNQNTEVKNNLIPLFKRLYNKEQFKEKEYKSWNTFYNNNIDLISENGIYLNVPKLDIGNTTNHIESFLRAFFASKSDKELLDIYNEEMNTNYEYIINTESTSTKSLQTNNELDRFIDKDSDSTTSIDLQSNKIFHQRISLSVSTPKIVTYQPTSFSVYQTVWRSTLNTSLYNPEITYDIRNLSILYQIELERILQDKATNCTDEEKEKIKNKFYTYVDTELNSITKKDVLDLIVSRFESIIPKQDFYITINEFEEILKVNNKWTNMLDNDSSSSNSLKYQLWIGYYVVPNNVESIVQELTSDGVSWKTILEKDATITRGLNHNPMYISPYLPMYVDVYKKIPYNMKIFLSNYAYTYDVLSETMLIEKNNSYDAKLVRTYQIVSSIVTIIMATMLAIIIAVVIFVATGGSGAVASVMVVIAIVSFALAGICQIIGVLSTNPSTKKKFNNLANTFNKIGGVATMLISLGAGIDAASLAQQITSQMVISLVKQTLITTTSLITSYHTSNGNNKDAVGWGIATAVLSLGSNIESMISNSTSLSTALLDSGLPILTQILNITNEIVSLVQNNRLEDIQVEIDKLNEKSEELRKQKEKESDELAQISPFSAFTSTRPVSLSKYDNFIDNKLSELDSQLGEINSDEIIEAQFEVLET